MEEIGRTEPLKDPQESLIANGGEAPGIQHLSTMIINGTLVAYMAAPVPPPPTALAARRKREREA